MLVLIEFILCVLAVIAAFGIPNLGAKWFLKIEQRLNRVARRRGWAVLSIGLTALVLRAALLPIEPIPLPQLHDEFSYLLMADTFAHGRLENPTHPMWVHFETFHVNQKPTYVSMYYPAQGVFLAIGQVFFGHPFWGVWLSVGIMCAAICWMLQGWLPPIWALAGGLLAVIRLGTFSYWANSYWGGAAAAIGGALVVGSLPRIKRKCRTQDAVTLGFGLVLVASSRPYEGTFLGLPVVLLLVKWLFDGKYSTKTFVRQAVLPLGLVLGLGAAGMLYYFWRTTGNPFLPPYLLNVRAYSPLPFFPWQPIKPAPEYRHPAMRDYYFGWWLFNYVVARSHPIIGAVIKVGYLWMFFVGSAFLLPLVMVTMTLPYGMSWKQMPLATREVMLIVFFGFVGILLPIFFNPHYAAPFVGAFYVLLLLAMQRVRRWKRRGKRTGLAIVRLTVLTCALMFGLRIRADKLHIPTGSNMPTWYSPGQGIPGRAKVLNQLNGESQNVLAIVRYHAPRDQNLTQFEWVYNHADIDAAKIVWARDMGAEENQELLNYFRDREVWLVEADERPVRLLPYRP